MLWADGKFIESRRKDSPALANMDAAELCLEFPEPSAPLGDGDVDASLGEVLAADTPAPKESLRIRLLLGGGFESAASLSFGGGNV